MRIKRRTRSVQYYLEKYISQLPYLFYESIMFDIILYQFFSLQFATVDHRIDKV
jgi:hypothetical protein